VIRFLSAPHKLLTDSLAVRGRPSTKVWPGSKTQARGIYSFKIQEPDLRFPEPVFLGRKRLDLQSLVIGI